MTVMILVFGWLRSVVGKDYFKGEMAWSFYLFRFITKLDGKKKISTVDVN